MTAHAQPPHALLVHGGPLLQLGVVRHGHVRRDEHVVEEQHLRAVLWGVGVVPPAVLGLVAPPKVLLDAPGELGLVDGRLGVGLLTQTHI